MNHLAQDTTTVTVERKHCDILFHRINKYRVGDKGDIGRFFHDVESRPCEIIDTMLENFGRQYSYRIKTKYETRYITSSLVEMCFQK